METLSESAVPATVAPSEASAARLVALVFGLLLLLAAGGFAASGDITRRNLILLLLGSIAFLISYLSTQPRLLLVFFWVISLTYNRNFFSFDALLGDNGSYGLYWIPADIFLAALLATWAVEAVVLKRSRPPLGRRLWPWFLPFAIACCLSLLVAGSPAWAAFELVRVFKFGLILWYTRFNLGRKEWWAAVIAFAAAALVQSTYDIFGSFRIMRLFGATADLQAVMQKVARFNPDIHAGVQRATGTMAHPNILAIYLVLLCPLILCIAIGLRRRAGLLLGLAGLVGLCGLVMSMSRVAWMILLVQVALLFVALTASGLVPLTRAIGGLSLAAALVCLAVLPFSSQLIDRWRGDFRQSIDFRARLNRIALDISGHAPYFGVGLSNQSLWLEKYDPKQVRKFREGSEFLRQVIPVRGIASVHNFYLLLLTETGIVGLLSFLLFLVGLAGLALNAARLPEPLPRAAGIGVLVGVVGMLGFGMTEFGIWLDPVFFTLAIVAGLTNNIPTALAPAASYKEET